MKTVETFLIEENKNLIEQPENVEQWKALCEEMGMTGQIELVEQTPSDNPIPFMCMKDSMKEMLKVLCPTSTRYQQYKADTIPLEALAMIKLAQDYFPYIEIWHDNEAPDPIAVGRTTDDYNAKYFLIARWGAEMTDWVKLYEQALKRLIREKKDSLNEKLNKVKSDLANVETLAKQQLRGAWTNWND